jgi:hypothetical protein
MKIAIEFWKDEKKLENYGKKEFLKISTGTICLKFMRLFFETSPFFLYLPDDIRLCKGIDSPAKC